jgi:transposase InsO family protein
VARAGDAGHKGGPTGEHRRAGEPGQTLQVDRCFVPAVHAVAARLPAVSGSSGRLVVYGPRPGTEDAARPWPGQVFADPEVAYATAMHEFVWRSAPRTPRRRSARPARPQRQEAEEQAARCAVRQQRRMLAAQRAPLLQQRQQEDAAWEVVCRERQARLRPEHWTPRQYVASLAAEDHWLLLHAQRRATLARRRQEDAAWQAALEQFQAAPPQAAKPPWIAILVVTDNCTRQCLGLPLFTAGPKVTAEVVIAALRALLPDQLQFLIADRGTHFTAQQFAQFAQEEDFVQVLIARHRPASNGIAERFVRTLKEWLADHAWSGAEALETWLEQFRVAYNDRPHQGLALPGLSPNEFAARFWLL